MLVEVLKEGPHLLLWTDLEITVRRPKAITMTCIIVGRRKCCKQDILLVQRILLMANPYPPPCLFLSLWAHNGELRSPAVQPVTSQATYLLDPDLLTWILNLCPTLRIQEDKVMSKIQGNS
jgi:hypothetical protein